MTFTCFHVFAFSLWSALKYSMHAYQHYCFALLPAYVPTLT